MAPFRAVRVDTKESQLSPRGVREPHPLPSLFGLRVELGGEKFWKKDPWAAKNEICF